MKIKTVIKKARSYIDTPFHHQGRLPGVGLDCVGVVMCAYDVKKLYKYEYKNYNRLPSADTLRTQLSLFCDQVQDIKPGDILLMRFDREPQHVALVTEVTDDRVSVLHAYSAVKRVVEHAYDAQWRSRTVAIYRVKKEIKLDE